MKTIKEWLRTLPDFYRELALANAERFSKWAHLPSLKVDSLSEAIRHLEWDASLEGECYWLKVYLWAISPSDYDLPALPIHWEVLREKSETRSLNQVKERIGMLRAATTKPNDWESGYQCAISEVLEVLGLVDKLGKEAE